FLRAPTVPRSLAAPPFPYTTLCRSRGVPLALREENGFQPDIDELRRLVTPRTKVLVLNSPNNPTGGVLSRAMAAMSRTASRESTDRKSTRLNSSHPIISYAVCCL